MTSESWSPRSALRSPLWWGALALLLVNDHVLKGAGLLPGLVTGKLSDFAGLIVAPVLLAALVGARTARGRAVGFAAVAAGFAAIKLSPGAAAGLVAALSWVGLHWRIWSDPSDLVALAMLPFAWRLCSGPMLRPAFHWPHLERAGLLLGLVACMATSQAVTPGQWQTTAYVINGADHPIDLRVRFPGPNIDFDALGDRAARALPMAAYDEGITFHLGPRATLPLAHRAALQAAGIDSSKVNDPGPANGLVLLQTDGLADTIVSWHALPVLTVPTNVDADFDGPALASGGVALLPAAPDAPTALFATASGAVLVQHAIATPEPSACAGTEGESFQWSALSAPYGPLLSVTTLPGGCLDLEIATSGTTSEHLSLCVPSSAFPFDVGDMLNIVAALDPGVASLRLLAGDGRELLVISTQATIAASVLPNRLVPIDCEGDRTDCGAYVVPAALEVATPGGIVRIASGEEAMIDNFDPGGRAARVIVGRAEQVIATSTECDAGRSLPRIVGDFAIVYGGAP